MALQVKSIYQLQRQRGYEKSGKAPTGILGKVSSLICGVLGMKILLPVAAPISYNPAHYLAKAFQQLGHEAKVVDQGTFYNVDAQEYDLIIGVDSGGPLNLYCKGPNTGMWFIDSRRNHKREIRNPSDDDLANEILYADGIVFQAQLGDVRRLTSHTHFYEKPEMRERVVHLPLAADPDVWCDEPKLAEKKYTAAFVGNCYDQERLVALSKLSELGILHWPGIEQAIMEAGAEVYRNAKIGLNIPSWWGSPECTDVNMRVFEVLSCGIPLITNNLFDLRALGILEDVHCYTYNRLEEIPDLIMQVAYSNDVERVGSAARRLILERHTYKHRAQTILEAFEHGNH
jgi:hypothetical protein